MGFGQDLVKGLTKSLTGDPLGFIGSGLNIGQQLFGSSNQEKQIKMQIEAQQAENEKNRQFNKMMAEYQNQQALLQWQRENAYNTPTAQMSRLRQAGLNPDLMYGGGVGNMMSASSVPLATASYGTGITPMSVNASPQIGDYLSDMSAQSADVRETLAQGDILLSDAKFRDALNQGRVDLQACEILVDKSVAKMNDEQTNKFRAEVRKIEKESEYFTEKINELKKICEGLDHDNAMKFIDKLYHEDKVKATLDEIAQRINSMKVGDSVSIGQLEIATKQLFYTGLLARGQCDLWNAEGGMFKALQGKYDAEKNKFEFDLEQAKKWDDAERIARIIGEYGEVVTDIIDACMAIGTKGMSEMIKNIVRGPEKPKKVGFNTSGK